MQDQKRDAKHHCNAEPDVQLGAILALSLAGMLCGCASEAPDAKQEPPRLEDLLDARGLIPGVRQEPEDREESAVVDVRLNELLDRLELAQQRVDRAIERGKIILHGGQENECL